MSQVVQTMIDRVKNEKITSSGLFILAGKASLDTKTPYIDMYWENGKNKTAFYVEPVTQTSYDKKL